MSNFLHVANIAREAPRIRVSLKDRYFPSGSQPTFHEEESLQSSSLPQKVGSQNWDWRTVKRGTAHSMVITLNCLAFHGYIYISAPDTSPQHIPATPTPDESQQRAISYHKSIDLTWIPLTLKDIFICTRYLYVLSGTDLWAFYTLLDHLFTHFRATSVI